MPPNWKISAEWEELDSGPPEERACFASVGIQAQDVWLTEGRDDLANRLRKAPLLSAYHLAEWIAWNWWRLRWEPRCSEPDWALSHHLTTIGGGYIWPNISIFSDGERTALISNSTDERPKTPFRYIVDYAAVIQASEFEAGVDQFIDEVVQRLDSKSVENTNLEIIWKSVLEERRTPDLAQKRKLEALLGTEPDEADPQLLSQLVTDAQQLSIRSIEEVAADRGSRGDIPTAEELRSIATSKGYEASPKDAVRLAPFSHVPNLGQMAAWRVGAAIARELRDQQSLNGHKIDNWQLAQLAGTRSAALTERTSEPGFSFALDENTQRSHIVLRSKWEAGRRFEVARLLGDRITFPGGRLFPATRAYTYRQKMQRSFAAEFLSPFDVVDDMLAGDYSDENQLEVAQHFGVSELTIRTQLVNHGRIEREDLNSEAVL